MAVLGCGRSGAGAAKLAAREGAAVTVLDSGNPEGLRAAAGRLEAAGYSTVLGDAALQVDVSGFDLVVVSPGIALGWAIAKQFVDAGVRVIGEMEFAAPFCGADIIGVTGTNGKTTTVELIAAMLDGCGERTIAAGNYGRPLSEIVCDSVTLSAVALEISSFQLETIETFRPQIAVWTNFAPDHLDRYDSLEAYRDAKLRLFENQTGEDWAVVNLRDGLEGLSAQTLTFSAFDEGADYRFEGGAVMRDGEALIGMGTTQLRGSHNAENLMAAMAVGQIRGHEAADLSAAVAGYSAPPHRCEPVGEVAGVEYINDSKATNLHALESALVSLGEVPLVLIAGGKDKGLPLGELAPLVGRHATHAVLIGEIRDELAGAWGGALPCGSAADLPAAVRAAADLAQDGGIVLFAPGTSSFDMFSGYEERGEAFRAAVRELNQQETPR